MNTFEELEPYICVICREILMDPVSLPCKHTACLDCLEKTLDHNKYQCFMCRKFIGSWYRTTKRKNTLVDDTLKNKIIEKYPQFIAMRLNGESLDIAPAIRSVPLSSPGEVKKEFENEMNKLNHEIQAEKEQEEKLSKEYIKEIENEEYALQIQEQEKIKFDEQIARELAAQFDCRVDTIQNNVMEQLMADEALARKLATNMGLPVSPKQSGSSPKIRIMKKRPIKTVSIGPMDRFLEIRRYK